MHSQSWYRDPNMLVFHPLTCLLGRCPYVSDCNDSILATHGQTEQKNKPW